MNFKEIDRRIFLKYLSLMSVSLGFPGSILSLAKRMNYSNKPIQPEASIKNVVLRVQSEEVIINNPDPYRYLDFIRTDKLDKMLAEGIKKFTSRNDLKKAWYDILTDYTPGDKIAIKPNFNFLNHGYRYTITSPQLINSVVKQLVEIVGVKPESIFLYDLCKTIPFDIVRNRIDYPINYIERMYATSIPQKIKVRLYYGLASADTGAEIKMRERIVYKNEIPVKCYLPKVVTKAHHLINMPLLTNHIFISNSGALKNHFGTVRFSTFHSFPGVLHGDVLNKSIVDINQHPHIKLKTRIIIGDGLFGVFDRGEGEGKKVWETLNNNFPRSIFIAKDPVAIDSVMASMIIKERKRSQLKTLSSEYLRDAMNSGLGVCEINPENDKFEHIEYTTLIL